MKSITKILAAFALCVFCASLTSCIHLYMAGSKTTYNHFLSDTLKGDIQFVGGRTDLDLRQGYKEAQKKPFYMIDGKQLRKQLQEGELHLVYTYVPGCGSDAYVNIPEIEDFCQENKLNLWAVLLDIDSNLYVLHNRDSQLFAIDFKYYKTQNNFTKFVKDFLGEDYDKKNHGVYYLFNGNKLVKQVDRLSEVKALLSEKAAIMPAH